MYLKDGEREGEGRKKDVSWLRNVPATCVSRTEGEGGGGGGGGGGKVFLGCVMFLQHVYLKDGVRGGRGGRKDFLVA